jgi:hypothetical protein
VSRGVAIVWAVLAACRFGFDPEQLDDAGQSDATDGGDQPLGQRVLVKASNSGAGDQFGHSVAVSGDGTTLAIGAPLEASAATTINGNQADDSAIEAGAVYVLRRAGDTWMQEAYVKAANTEQGDQFGWSVALSNDGTTLAVGARREDGSSVGINGANNNAAMSSGAAYVFVRAGSSWTQQAYVKASNTEIGDSFGERVALSNDGNTLAVGAPLEASAATTINGNQASNTAANAGAVYVYTRAGTTWTQQAYVKPSNAEAEDQFGYKVALSGTGDTLVVGAFREDGGVPGNPADNSAQAAGAAYLFTRAGTTWSQAAYLKPTNIDAGDNFGYGVAVSSDGTRIAVAAEGESSASTGIGGTSADNNRLESGALYVFNRGGAVVSLAAYVKATNPDANDQLGFGLALSGNGAVLAGGAAYESSADETVPSDDSLLLSGAAYTYLDDGGWITGRFAKATNPGADDQFGWQCALSATGTTLVVSAPYEDSSTTGVGPAPNEAASDRGAVYIFY